MNRSIRKPANSWALEIQQITYNEFLPALLGQSLPAYSLQQQRRSNDCQPFSTATYRNRPHLRRRRPPATERRRLADILQALSLADSFFNPTRITAEGGISPLIKGLASQQMQEVDSKIVDPVRNFLFGPPGAGGFDLASLNIQRGRDHGLPDYNTLRVEYGLAPVSSFADITSDVALQAALASVYASVNDIDPWIGGLSEDHIAGGSIGELFATIIMDQFVRLRDGDRFWYQNSLTPEELDMISGMRLSDILALNTGLTSLQSNVFFVPEPSSLVLLAGLGAAAIARRRA